MSNGDITFNSKKPERLYIQQMKKIIKEPWLFAIIILILGSLFLFSIYPIFRVISETVVSEGKIDLSVVMNAIKNQHFLYSFWSSIKLGIISAVFSTIIGFTFAYSVTRTEMKGKKFFNLIAMMPIISPPFVIALAVILLFGRSGIISNGIFGWTNTNVYGFTSLVAVQTMAFFPLAYLNIRGVLESMNASLEEAAENLGASRWKVFRSVTLPLSIPAIMSALLIVFIKSIEDFGNPMVIAGDYPTLAVQAYMQITGMFDLRTGALLAVAILLPSLTAFLIQRFWIQKKSYVTVTGKPTHSDNLIKDRHIVWPLFIFCLLITAIILMFYGTVVWVSLVKSWGLNSSLSFDNFRFVFERGAGAIKDSFLISIISTPITAIVGMIIAYLIIRKQFIGRKVLEISSMLSFAVPGLVIGIGYILAFNQLPLILTGTAAIIILALTVRNLSVGIEAGTNSLRQVDPSVEEASINLGANSLMTFWKISLPLMKSALYSGLVYSFVRSMTSISAIIFLVSVNWNLLTVSILSEIESSRFGVAAAYCVILIIIVLLAFGVLEILVNFIGSRKRRA